MSCNSFEEAEPLFRMAEKYNVKGLISLCREVLVKRMAPKYLVRTAILGYMGSSSIDFGPKL